MLPSACTVPLQELYLLSMVNLTTRTDFATNKYTFYQVRATQSSGGIMVHNALKPWCVVPQCCDEQAHTTSGTHMY